MNDSLFESIEEIQRTLTLNDETIEPFLLHLNPEERFSLLTDYTPMMGIEYNPTYHEESKVNQEGEEEIIECTMMNMPIRTSSPLEYLSNSNLMLPDLSQNLELISATSNELYSNTVLPSEEQQESMLVDDDLFTSTLPSDADIFFPPSLHESLLQQALEQVYRKENLLSLSPLPPIAPVSSPSSMALPPSLIDQPLAQELATSGIKNALLKEEEDWLDLDSENTENCGW